MVTALTCLYLLAFQAAAFPAMVRVWRRGSSADLSLWREALLLAGIACQFVVMRLTHADVRVWISPIVSALSISVLTIAIWRHR